MTEQANFIAADWGTSNLRLWVWQGGKCVWQLNSDQGVRHYRRDTFPALWQSLLSRCPAPLQPDTRVIMSGMIGSERGWVTAPYLDCPARLSGLAAHLQPVPDAGPWPIWIVPGLRVNAPGHYNVMRGEETQLYGSYTGPGVYLLPGTHSKWVSVAGDNVTAIETVITGELFQMMSAHSVLLPADVAQRRSPAAFAGAVIAGSQSHCLPRDIFSLRARMLCGALEPDLVQDSLSGLLIGHEIAAMATRFGLQSGAVIRLTGSAGLNERYGQALECLGFRASSQDGESAFLAGIRRILNEHYR